MAYFLRKTKKNKGTYLQICETVYNKETKLSSNRNYQILGYVEELKSKYDDPISHFEEVVKSLNEKNKEEKALKVPDKTPTIKNIGYFLLKALINTLGVKDELNIMGNGHNFEHSISEFIETMIYCQIVKPSSKLKNAEEIIPSLQNSTKFTEDQIYRMINFIGCNYKKYIELFNAHIEKTYPRNYKHLFFDCTNFYFEIDLPSDDKQKGPSKENRKEPIIGQALLLDTDQVPLAMEMYPGNESEKPHIRKLIEEMKNKTNITGRTIQVADKGLNCARNIYAASHESNDGYIFSKSIHGNNLSETEKKWVLLDDNEQNKWFEILDEKGKLLFKVKSCIDTFEYSFINDDGEKISFKQEEKRIISYNPSLAEKHIKEINKQVEKVKKLNTIKSLKRCEYGDAVKYVNFKANDEDVELVPSLNYDKIDEDKKYAGYNMIVTSEKDLSDIEIYKIYHGLWRIEESFRITKSYLEARPVYLKTKESIYGHFLICFLSLLLLRILEFKIFKNKVNSYEIIKYIRSFNIAKTGEKYISTILNSEALQTIKDITQITCLDNLYLTDKHIENLLYYEF